MRTTTLAALGSGFAFAFANAQSQSPSPTPGLRLGARFAISNSSTSAASAASLDPTGSGEAYASACDALWQDYYSSSQAYGQSVFSTISAVESYNTTYTFYATTYTCESTCGTICYAGDATTYSTSYSSEVGVYTDVYEVRASYPSPTPTCSVALSDCVNLWNQYSSADNAWYSDVFAGITPGAATASPTSPACDDCAAGPCTVDIGGVDLFFWPVTGNVSRDMCASNPVGGPATSPISPPLYTPTTTGSADIVNGNTFYQGNIYLSLWTISATNPCGSTIGRVHTSDVLAVASTDLFTMRGYPKNNIPWSVSWADFNPHIPYSAYYGQPACEIGWPPCSVVFDNQYFPQFVMPSAIRQLDPAWSTCELAFFGLADPPTALQAITVLDPTTRSSTDPPQSDNDPGLTSSAKPGNTPSSPAQQTSSPGPTGHPGGSDPASTSNKGNGDPPAPGSTSSPPTTTKAPGSSSHSSHTITVGGSTITVAPGGSVVVTTGTTVTSGGPGATISGTTLSVGPSGVVVGSGSGTTTIPIGSVPVTLTVGSETLTVNPSNSAIVEPGTTLTNGDPALTVSGTVVSVGSTAATFIGPSGTQIVPFADPSGVVTIGGQTFTEDPTGGLVLGPGTTLHPGDPAATISGTTVSVGSTSVVLIGPSGTETIIMDPTAGATATPPGDAANGGWRAAGLNMLMVGGLALLASLFSAS